MGRKRKDRSEKGGKPRRDMMKILSEIGKKEREGVGQTREIRGLLDQIA